VARLGVGRGRAPTGRRPPICTWWFRPIRQWQGLRPPLMAQQLRQAHYVAAQQQYRKIFSSPMSAPRPARALVPHSLHAASSPAQVLHAQCASPLAAGAGGTLASGAPHFSALAVNSGGIGIPGSTAGIPGQTGWWPPVHRPWAATVPMWPSPWHLVVGRQLFLASLFVGPFFGFALPAPLFRVSHEHLGCMGYCLYLAARSRGRCYLLQHRSTSAAPRYISNHHRSSRTLCFGRRVE
jgi:hypothetical protein